MNDDRLDDGLNASKAFLKALAHDNKLNKETILKRFREGQHATNPFTGKELRLVEVELRELLEPTGILDDPIFDSKFNAFVQSVIESVVWGILMGHDQSGEDGEQFAFKIRQLDGPDLVNYLHELWSSTRDS